VKALEKKWLDQKAYYDAKAKPPSKLAQLLEYTRRTLFSREKRITHQEADLIAAQQIDLDANKATSSASPDELTDTLPATQLERDSVTSYLTKLQAESQALRDTLGS